MSAEVVEQLLVGIDEGLALSGPTHRDKSYRGNRQKFASEILTTRGTPVTAKSVPVT